MKTMQNMKTAAKIAAILIACAQLIGCGISLNPGIPIRTEPEAAAAFIEAVKPQEPEEITVIVNTPEKTKEYHVEDVPDELLEAAHLVRLTSDALDFDVYACMLHDGEVRFYVFAHEETSMELGVLRVFMDVEEEDIAATIDFEDGFILMPDVAECELAEATEYDGVGEAIIHGVDDIDEENEPVARMYYPMTEDGGLMPGAIPVDIQELEDNSVAVVYRLDEEHYLIVYVVGDESDVAEETAAPAETEAPASGTPVAAPTKEPSQSADPTVTAKPTNSPSNTQKPTATPKPTATAKPTATSKPTATPKPTQTPKPTPTPKPTATPTPTEESFTWRCKYCGCTFNSEYDWNQHAYYNPGCYYYGRDMYHTTPTPATPTPTPKPTPTPDPGGHWEYVWVVDVPEKCHTVWVCNVCGKEFLTWEECRADQSKHAQNHDAPLVSWSSHVVTDEPEQGHWEKVWVPDP